MAIRILYQNEAEKSKSGDNDFFLLTNQICLYVGVAFENEILCIISIFLMQYLFYELSRRIREVIIRERSSRIITYSNSSRKLIKQIFHFKNTYNSFIAIPFIRSCHIVFRSCSNINKTLHHDNSSTLRGKK